MRAPTIEILTSDGCPHGDAADALVRAVAEELTPGSPVTRTVVKSEEQARELAFPGSPTILVDGIDLDGAVDSGATFS